MSNKTQKEEIRLFLVHYVLPKLGKVLTIVIFGIALVGEYVGWRYSVASYLFRDSDKRVNYKISDMYNIELSELGIKSIHYDRRFSSEDSKSGTVDIELGKKGLIAYFGESTGIFNWSRGEHKKNWDDGLIDSAYLEVNNNEITYWAVLNYSKCPESMFRTDCLYHSAEMILQESLPEVERLVSSEKEWDTIYGKRNGDMSYDAGK